MNILPAVFAALFPVMSAAAAEAPAPKAPEAQAPAVAQADASLAPEKAAPEKVLAPVQPAQADAPCIPKEGEPAAALAGCSQYLQEMAQVYKEAYEKMGAWAKQTSIMVVSLQKKEEEIKAKIQENEAALTKLKFSKTKANTVKLKELQAQTDDLWAELRTIEKKSSAVCGTIAKGTRQKVKDIADDINKRFELVHDKLQQ
jgi:hypothetical protein